MSSVYWHTKHKPSCETEPELSINRVPLPVRVFEKPIISDVQYIDVVPYITITTCMISSVVYLSLNNQNTPHVLSSMILLTESDTELLHWLTQTSGVIFSCCQCSSFLLCDDGFILEAWTLLWRWSKRHVTALCYFCETFICRSQCFRCARVRNGSIIESILFTLQRFM